VRVTLIHNPGAGKQGRENGRNLAGMLEELGHDVRYRSSKEDGWKKALKQPADLVVVAGGDGTVARVARRMAGRGVPVALLPSGTANNIARSLGQVERPFEELARAWPQARRVKLDVGVAKGPWGERYFIEGVGAGVFAQLLANPAGDKAKKAKRPVEKALERLRKVAARCKPLEIAAQVDGRDISGHYLMLEAINLRYVGPNLHLAQDTQPGDGQFDVVMVTEAERPRLVHYLEHWQENRERLAVLPSLSGRRLRMEWTGFELHIDDKLKPRDDAEPSEMAGMVEARMDGDTVEFLVPDGRTKR
jgi:diacylglycerol kinase family enzyme